MIPIVTAREMRAIDEATIRDHVPGAKLMERAGGAVRDEILNTFGRPKRAGKRGKPPYALIVCGKGNNGGDGLVVARLLKADGYKVKTYLVGKTTDVKGDALTNLKRLRRARLELVDVAKCGLEAFQRDLAQADLVVDAIFGTGFEGEPRGLAAEVIEIINLGTTPVVSVDMPSGVDATTGKLVKAVTAELTVTMGLPKLGQVLYPGKASTGDLAIADIGIPDEVIAKAGLKTLLVGKGDVVATLPIRPPTAHKWSCGHVVCIAGSTGLTGAATLASHSALRAGAGLVTLAIPRSLNAIMEIKLTEVMTRPADETPAGSLALSALDELRALVARADCVAIGPGLSLHDETVGLVRKLVPALGKPCVLDADGINAFAGRAGDLKSLGFPLIVTPHAGEAARLFGVEKAEIAADPVGFAARGARELGAVLVLKGAPTIVAAPDGETYINPTGNPGLATAGSGDVLTGTIAGLVAQGMAPSRAAYSGVYIHGAAGDMLLAEKGHFGYLAGEIADKIPETIANIISD
ncbi:MAG TPA: NAD(P)H-hydrate dehydratase [bacterium]|nr:NAD(P)H-hydrate dehydratase [bacterium]